MTTSLSMLVSLMMAVAAAGLFQVGSVDVLDDSTGDGAGCFFFLAGSEPNIHVLIDRDGFGWIRLDGDIVKLQPARDFVRWPSETDDKLQRVYRSETTTAELNIEVTSGCGEYDDNCLVTYEGTLKVTHGQDETTLKVEGNCAC